MNAVPSMMTPGDVVADVNDMPAIGSPAPDTQAAESARARLKRERERNKLDKRLTREVGRAIGDFNMIEEGDKVMVCLSGGKDSYGMLDILLKLRERAPIHFDIIAVNLDQKQPGFPDDILPRYLTELGVPFHIETQDTYSIVTRVIEEGKTMCSLCSRLRRGILYRVADELGATKIALGHHRDDIVATFFLNMFYGGTLKSMPPKLVSDDGRHTVIRPLAYVKEADLIAYADWKGFPIIPCNLCGSQENLKRKESSRLIATWEKQFPGRIDNIFNALSRVTPSHLMDRDLFDFVNLKPTGVPDADGDTAFDAVDPVSPTAASACGSTDETDDGVTGTRSPITEHAVRFLRPQGN
ncbi:tRNA 2-thiocytidine biosynthesis protein TtcA [Pigmentiphaga litoralis]|uniref:tRNA-cytidine(32) 2-sulfurtransferase n=2 Tax=Pigmentiphaga litoralis TaxID=516702 RepID=A0A7Y9IRC7_9BURK|nr:tRNA 2-thiocytidine biosynthesis protein TtcA [Pigmentiphaga litoralis]NYE81562.1 tRNA 2-thiocytidine biosynthesis protein TtcA [Pigmentiphaga litoralis]